MHKLNGIALKRWARALLSKGFTGLKANLEKVQRRKENALKAYLFDEQRSTRLGWVAFRENRAWAKHLKRMNIRALKWFSKYYMRVALKSWKQG